jgi:hypothetical protein
MTDVELITDDILQKAKEVYSNAYALSTKAKCFNSDYAFRRMLEAIQDDIVRPYKRDAMAYKKALKKIACQNKREEMEECQLENACYITGYHSCIDEARKALKNDVEE